MVVSLLLIIARNAQSTQNSNFVISWQYLKIELKEEVYILHVDKHQTFLQVDTIDPGGMARHAQIRKNKQVYKIIVIFQNFTF